MCLQVQRSVSGTVLAISTAQILVCIVSASPADTQAQICPRYFYHDHGTDRCEHCSDICDNQHYTGTVDQCWELCKAYADIQWPPAPLAATPTSAPTTVRSGGLSTKAVISIYIVPIVCILALVALIIAKRKDIIKKFRHPSTSAPYPRQTAIVMPEQIHLVDGPSPAEEMMRATAGIQPEEEDGTNNAEANDDHIFFTQSAQLHMEESISLLRAISPVQVTAEGDKAPCEMLVAHKQVQHPVKEVSTESFDPDCDLDSTEPKTLQPSMTSYSNRQII